MPASSKATARRPRVCIGSLFRDSDSRGELDRYIQQIEALDYPKDLLRIVCLEGDSIDSTRQKLQDWNPTFPKELLRLDVSSSADYRTITEQRLRNLSNCANEVLDHFGDEDYLFWVTSDLTFPPDIINILLSVDKQVVSCPVLIAGSNRFYDVWGFRQGQQQVNRVGGVYGPGCFHWDFPWHPVVDIYRPFRVDTVGSIFLAKAEVVNSGARFTAEEDIVGFCKEAGARGYEVWMTTKTRVYHSS